MFVFRRPTGGPRSVFKEVGAARAFAQCVFATYVFCSSVLRSCFAIVRSRFAIVFRDCEVQLCLAILCCNSVLQIVCYHRSPGSCDAQEVLTEVKVREVLEDAKSKKS